MDHDETIEVLELAAVEPGGLERLAAGDTPAAAAVAGHLAGCPTCAEELERLRRQAPLLRDAVRTTPPPDLRARTLAFVREVGVERPGSGAPAVSPDTGSPGAAPPGAVSPSTGPVRRVPILPWVAAIAAAVALSIAASALLIGGPLDRRLADQDRAIGGLVSVTMTTLEITADPASRRVALDPAGDGAMAGSLVFSPTTGRLVVVATGLAEPPSASEYRCWLEIDGRREDVGRMYPAGGLSYWVGATPVIATAPAGARFGVSLVESVGSGPEVEPVLVGSL